MPVTVTIFIDRVTQQRVGPILNLRSEERIYELLRRCHANRETVSIVEMALTQRRPCMIDIDLTDHQYIRLKRSRNDSPK